MSEGGGSRHDRQPRPAPAPSAHGPPRRFAAAQEVGRSRTYSVGDLMCPSNRSVSGVLRVWSERCSSPPLLRVTDAGPSQVLITRTGAGVRKPSGKEPAGRCAVTVLLALWGLRRGKPVGVDLEQHYELRRDAHCAATLRVDMAMSVPNGRLAACFREARTRLPDAGR